MALFALNLIAFIDVLMLIYNMFIFEASTSLLDTLQTSI